MFLKTPKHAYTPCKAPLVLNQSERFIGMMSGTSLDAIDVVSVDLSFVKTKEAKSLFSTALKSSNIRHYELAYPRDLRDAVLAVQRDAQVTLSSLLALEQDLTRLYHHAVSSAFEDWGIEKSSIRALANHGQTLYHHAYPTQVSQARQRGQQLTLQVGDPSYLAESLGIPVITDFRRGDTAVGGQGAPLLPFYDALAFSEENKTVIAHNLGGISNVTVLPAQSLGIEPFAFDTGLANLWIDRAMNTYFSKPYDVEGHVASSGECLPALFDALVHHPFYDEPLPKSTGRDAFSDERLFDLVETYAPLEPKASIITTLTHATAYTMAQAYQRWIFPQVKQVDVIIFSGGGVENTYLLTLFQRYWQDLGLGLFPQLERPERYGVPNKAKEALGFAYLGWAKWHGLPNTLPACTGAKRYVSAGLIYTPFSASV